MQRLGSLIRHLWKAVGGVTFVFLSLCIAVGLFTWSAFVHGTLRWMLLEGALLVPAYVFFPEVFLESTTKQSHRVFWHLFFIACSLILLQAIRTQLVDPPLIVGATVIGMLTMIWTANRHLSR